MKTLLSIIFIVILGCSSWFINPNTGEHYVPPEVTEFAANTMGFTAGIAASRLEPWVDITLRNIYTIAVQGRLNIPELNSLVSKFLKSNDLATIAIANRILKMAEMLDAVVKDNQILYIEELDPILMNAMAKGYVEGFDLGKQGGN